MRAEPSPGHRGRREPLRRGSARRGERGDTLAFVVLWPAMIVAIVLLAVHTFIVVNARAEASLAASAGLRAAWRAAAESNLALHGRPTGPVIWREPDEAAGGRIAEAERLRDRAADAVEQVAGAEDGWRWWTGAVATTYSDWCHPAERPNLTPPQVGVPFRGETGWVRVVVSGEIIGPLSWLWPGRLDRVYATAEGPALLRASPAARLERPGDGAAVVFAADEPGRAPLRERWADAGLPRC
ncbi:MAG: hypothetical protein OXE75_18580 [bacterium]|nr:hypothetical protein [bacterium]